MKFKFIWTTNRLSKPSLPCHQIGYSCQFAEGKAHTNALPLIRADFSLSTGNLRANEKSAHFGPICHSFLGHCHKDKAEAQRQLSGYPTELHCTDARCYPDRFLTYPGGVVAYLHARMAGRFVQLNAADGTRVVLREFGLLVARHLEWESNCCIKSTHQIAHQRVSNDLNMLLLSVIACFGLGHLISRPKLFRSDCIDTVRSLALTQRLVLYISLTSLTLLPIFIWCSMYSKVLTLQQSAEHSKFTICLGFSENVHSS